MEIAVLKKSLSFVGVPSLVHGGQARSIVIEYTQPGKPTQNAFIERFNGSYRQGVLDAWCFMSLTQVREETDRWLIEYNTIQPHEALGDVSPIEFLTDRGYADVSSYA